MILGLLGAVLASVGAMTWPPIGNGWELLAAKACATAGGFLVGWVGMRRQDDAAALAAAAARQNAEATEAARAPLYNRRIPE